MHTRSVLFCGLGCLFVLGIFYLMLNHDVFSPSETKDYKLVFDTLSGEQLVLSFNAHPVVDPLPVVSEEANLNHDHDVSTRGQRYIIDKDNPIQHFSIEYWGSAAKLFEYVTQQYVGDIDAEVPGSGRISVPMEDQKLMIHGVRSQFQEVIYYYNFGRVDGSYDKEYSNTLSTDCLLPLEDNHGALFFSAVAAEGHDTCDYFAMMFTDFEIEYR